MVFKPGNVPHNKKPIDEVRLIREYESGDPTAVKRLATEYGVTIQTIYWRLEKLGVKRRSGGDANRGTQARENNPNWGGGKCLCSQGYVLVHVGEGKQVREHRLVAEEMLGRSLSPEEVVHHRNGDRTDNRPENLQVLPSQSEHMKIHRTALKAVGEIT